MKFLIVFVAVLGLTVAAPSFEEPQTRGLQEDFQDILALIPLSEWRVIAQSYLKNDAEFISVVKYLQGPEWAGLVEAVQKNPTWVEFKVYLNEAGIDIEAIIKFIHDLIAGAETKHTVQASTRGLREFVDECLALVDSKALLALVNDKLKTSPEFKALYEKLAGDKAKGLFEAVRALPEVQRVAARLTEMGINVKAVVDFIYAFLGW